MGFEENTGEIKGEKPDGELETIKVDDFGRIDVDDRSVKELLKEMIEQLKLISKKLNPLDESNETLSLKDLDENEDNNK